MHPSPRPPAVAGMFYPGPAKVLAAEVDALLGAECPALPGPIKAIIAPHAGYIYSGPTAGLVYGALRAQGERIRRVVLLGPTHRVAVRGLAVPTVTAFATPLGDIPIDQAALAAVADLPQVVASDLAHAQEHSLEVHLPFLQKVLGDFALAPFAVGQASPDAVAEVLERLWGGPETLIVVSSDLSHFHTYREAQRLDAATCQAILRFSTALDPEQACGAYPINGLLLAAHRHGLAARLIDLCNSGDTAGDKSRVVGYAAFALISPTPAQEAPDV